MVKNMTKNQIHDSTVKHNARQYTGDARHTILHVHSGRHKSHVGISTSLVVTGVECLNSPYKESSPNSEEAWDRLWCHLRSNLHKDNECHLTSLLILWRKVL